METTYCDEPGCEADEGYGCTGHAQPCVACGSAEVVARGESMMHGITYAECANHIGQGYEHAMAEHQPCNC